MLVQYKYACMHVYHCVVISNIYITCIYRQSIPRVYKRCLFYTSVHLLSKVNYICIYIMYTALNCTCSCELVDFQHC